MDELEEELQHQEFLEECNALVERIMWRVAAQPSVSVAKFMWDDIDVFGDEPVFASLLFDKALEELE